MSLSTHVLDTTLGRPAAGISISLARLERAEWVPVEEKVTDADGRVGSLLATTSTVQQAGTFRLRFATGAYFSASQQASLYPYVDVVVQLEAGTHYHIPLLLTANAYTTYRGS